MLVSAIVAVARNGVIGRDNQIPWHLPADLAFFKRTTLGHCIIMGRKSFRSIGRPLPKRTNIVVTRDAFFVAAGVVVVHSIEEAIDYAYNMGETEAFVIGGGEIYVQSMELLDRVYLTEVDVEVEGDVHFPEMNPAEWRELWREDHAPDEKNALPFRFRLLERVGVEDQGRPGPATP